MLFISLVIKNLIRRKMRTLLTIAGISVGIMAVVSLVTISNGFENEWIETIKARGADAIIMRKGTVYIMTSSVDEKIKQSLLMMENIESVAGVLVDLMAIEDSPGIVVYGWEPDEFLFQHIKIVNGKWGNQGRFPKDNKMKELIIGTITSENFKKKTGDKINIETDVFNVVGIYESESIFENGSLIMPIKLMQELMGREGKVTFFNLRLKDKNKYPEVKKAIEGKFPELRITASDEAIKQHNGINIAKGMAWATSIIALIVGMVGTLNTMSMSVFERTREFGLLRAVGWRKRRITRMILMESVIMSVAGWFIGSVTGKILLLLLSHYSLTKTFVRGDIPLYIVGEAFVVAMILGILGGIYPAIRGSNLSPMEALRYE